MSGDEVSTTQKRTVAGAVAIDYATLTDIGMRREENQDSFGVIEAGDTCVYVVADGMGGVQGGAIASSLAIETLRKSFAEMKTPGADEIRSAIERANSEIFARGSTDPSLVGMGTTVVALVFIGKSLYVVSVGDSRAYLIRRGQMAQVTEDHTLVMELLKAGTITPEQAHNHPVAHMLTRSLGPSNEVEVDCRLCTDGPYRGDKFLLCSDGLYNMLNEDEVFGIMSSAPSLEEAAKELVAQANKRGGVDNITVILVELGQGFPEESVEEEPDTSSQGTESTISETGASSDEPESSSVDSTSAAIQKKVTEEGSCQDDHKEAANLSETDKSQAEVGQGGPAEEEKVQVDEVIEEQRRRLEDPKVRAQFGAAGENEQQQATPPPGKKPTPKPNLEKPVSLALAWIIVIVLASVVGFTIGILLYSPRTIATKDVAKPAVSPIELTAQLLNDQGQVQEQNAETEVEVPLDLGQADNQSVSSTRSDDSVEQKVAKKVNALVRRQNAIMERLDFIEGMLGAFEGPLSGKLGEMLNRASSHREELVTGFDKLKNELDGNYKKLSMWYERRAKLEGTDALNMATELSSVSDIVKEKKQLFENTTWVYLTEAEKLKYNPDDEAQAKKVAELLRARKLHLSELSRSIKAAVDDGIAQTDQKIAELSAKKEEMEADLRSVQAQIEVCKILLGNDASAKEEKKQALIDEKEQLKAELAEISRVADLDSGSAS